MGHIQKFNDFYSIKEGLFGKSTKETTKETTEEKPLKAYQDRKVKTKINHKGRFLITGYQHLSRKGKKLYDKAQKGDELVLIPRPDNKYDNTAIEAQMNGTQIGWVSARDGGKDKLFQLLMGGEANDNTLLSVIDWRGDHGLFGKFTYYKIVE